MSSKPTPKQIDAAMRLLDQKNVCPIHFQKKINFFGELKCRECVGIQSIKDAVEVDAAIKLLKGLDGNQRAES